MRLREATESDYDLILAWRNNPLINRGFYSQSKGHLIDWDEHIEWLNSRSNWTQFIIEHGGRRIGCVSIGQQDHWSPEIGYYIGEPSSWGQGLGHQAVELALRYLTERGYEYTHTTVLKDNARSLNLLLGLGFKVLGDARQDEVWLTKDLKGKNEQS